ncbi:MAG: hypothetical protein DRQ37_04835 [Gammaproteobacteria bacterium]|nr:MAG: hypothetical protein DRQ37_04835 [Gammaproteobacteria bacterium]
MSEILVLYSSQGGNVVRMAGQVARSVAKIDGVHALGRPTSQARAARRPCRKTKPNWVWPWGGRLAITA